MSAWINVEYYVYINAIISTKFNYISEQQQQQAGRQ